MKSFLRSRYLLIGILAGLLLGGGWFAWAAIQSQVGMNVNNNGVWNPITGTNTGGVSGLGTLKANVMAVGPHVMSILDGSVGAWTASDADNAASSNLGGIALYTFARGSNSNARILQPTIDGAPATGLLSNNPYLYNGAAIGVAFDRLHSASGTNLSATTSTGAQVTVPLSTWSITSSPAAGSKATASKAAGGGTVRHVTTSVTACYSDTATAVARSINLRDGASGAGTVLWTALQAISVADAAQCITLSGLAIIGTANTAMTIEFDAAGAATSQETVTLTGFSVP